MRVEGNIGSISVNNSGRATLICDSEEDLWVLYTILAKGDFVKMKSTRKVEVKSGKSTKKTITISIKVEDIDFSQSDGQIRVRGKNRSENDYINLNQYQTFTITTGVYFSLFKVNWNMFQVEALQNACNPDKTCDLALVLMEEGIANIYIVGQNVTYSKGEVKKAIGKKKGVFDKTGANLKIFFTKLEQAILERIELKEIKCLIVASPGFTKDEFRAFLEESNKIDKEDRAKFIYVHSSSGYKHSISEVLKSDQVKQTVKETKAIRDVEAIELLNETIGKDMDLVVFGRKNVEECLKRSAVRVLMISDMYLRNLPNSVAIAMSKKIIDAEDAGTDVRRMNSMHMTGESKKINRIGWNGWNSGYHQVCCRRSD